MLIPIDINKIDINRHKILENTGIIVQVAKLGL